jgi:predicted naringenin-chalcone synthase
MQIAQRADEGGAWLNAVGTATPPHDVHAKFVDFAPRMLATPRDRRLFGRMAQRSGIEHRYSVFAPDPDPENVDAGGFFRRGGFPDTAARMGVFERHALPVALAAVEDLAEQEGPGWKAGISHLIVTCCTGFVAPGVDAGLIDRLGLDPAIERTLVGFMGCNAAFNALKLARHVVRSDRRARVLVVSLELCTLHLQETEDLERALSFLIFADGCAAAIVSAEPRGLELERFASAMLREGAELITWRIGVGGFDMHLSGEVPAVVGRALPAHAHALAGQRPRAEIAHWAVHPGGRSILDAVEDALELGPEDLAASRAVLRDFGNMSSATVMFVLRRLLREGGEGAGLAFGFGPGLSVESMAFRKRAA